MKRRIFSSLFIIYTVSLNCMFILVRKPKLWIRSTNIRRIFTALVSSSGYLLYEKTGNKSQYFLLDAKFYDDDSQEQQLAFDAENDTHFLLYTPKNLNTPQTIKLKDEQSLLESNFDPNNPVR